MKHLSSQSQLGNVQTLVVGRKQWTVKLAVSLLSLGLSALVSFLSPAFAETYTAGAAGHNAASVGTNGSSADYADIAVSQGGCAYGAAIAIALGESGCEYDASAPLAIGFLGADSRSGLIVDPVSSYPWAGGLAVSDTGETYQSELPGGGTGVSGTGHASGSLAVSGGDATAHHGTLALAVTGDAYAERTEMYSYRYGSEPTEYYGTRPYECPAYVDDHAVAASGTGDAYGCTAVAPLGAADGGTNAIGGSYARSEYLAVSSSGSAVADNTGNGVLYPSSAVGWGDSSVSGWGLVCVSATGNCYGGLISAAPLGNTSARSSRHVLPEIGDYYPPTVAVGGGDAYADRGLATVSLTGNGGGGSVANVCPMGHCS